jgi:hypothetical protein
MPSEFSSAILSKDKYLDSLTYKGPDGRKIVRPPGLGDAPGAVCGAGAFALFLGLAFIAIGRNLKVRVTAAVLATLGAAALFLTLVRSSFIVAVAMIILYILLLIWQRRFVTAGIMIAISTAIIAGAFTYAYFLGGENILLRFFSIINDDPTTFYYKNRGSQVEQAFWTLLPTYPFGAGLGRWGMMYFYFGDGYNLLSPPIHVEIQWPAWIIDGGIFFLIIYPIAIIITIKANVTLIRLPRDRQIQDIVAIILSANVGLLALIFSYPIFCSISGMQFWFLAGALHGLAQKMGVGVGKRPLLAPVFEPGPASGRASCGTERHQ